MSDFRKRNEEGSLDTPPYSRLFIVCGKQTTEEDLREAFSKYGDIESIRVVAEQGTGRLKGIAFIKFAKTTQAALALDELHGTMLPKATRPLKVLIAGSRSSIQSDTDIVDVKRIFITISRTATEQELREYFEEFGHVVSVIIQRDRETQENRGFAYITYTKFYSAARAFEEADPKYRVLFALPKAEKRPNTIFESNISALSHRPSRTDLTSLMNVQPEGYTRICALCSPYLTKQHVEDLFNLIPGMLHCQFATDLINRCPKIFVTYSNPVSAAYAVRKLHNFEYPPGQKVLVKPEYSRTYERESVRNEVPNVINNLKTAMTAASSSTPDLKQLVDAIAEASSLIKSATTGINEKDVKIDGSDLNFCSVQLPDMKPLADINSLIAKRCFLVCNPQPPPQTVLRDIFCRFGDLINVYTIPNKTVGYACYATVEAAEAAMKTLHGAEICGMRMKVLEAEDKNINKRLRTD